MMKANDDEVDNENPDDDVLAPSSSFRVRLRPCRPNYSLSAKILESDVERFKNCPCSEYSDTFEPTMTFACHKDNVKFIWACVLIPEHEPFMKYKYLKVSSGGFKKEDCVIPQRKRGYIRISGFDDPEAKYFYFCKDTWNDLTDEGAIFTFLGQTCLFINGELMPSFPLRSEKFNVFGPTLLKNYSKGKCLPRAGTDKEPSFVLEVNSEITVTVKS